MISLKQPIALHNASSRILRARSLVWSRVQTSSRGSSTRAQAGQNEGDFFENIKRVAKKVQGALPIVGLVSRWTSSEGGFDELAYPEYSRSLINASTEKFTAALAGLEKRHGKEANRRWLFLLLWMVKTGAGLVPPKDIISAARRMRVTQDMEIEIDRFEITRSNSLKKYDRMQPPEGKIKDQVNLGIDAICMLCIGLTDAQPVSDDDVEILVSLITGAFPEADRDMILNSISGKAARAGSWKAMQ